MKEQRQIRKEQIKKEMLNTTEYIDWLIDFTEKYPIFSSEDWLYNEEQLEKEDYNNVIKLPLLFENIYEFAHRNYIASTVHEWGESYHIQKDDVHLNIGYNAGQGTSFYCEREEDVKEKYAINYYSMMNENLPMRTMYVDKRLQTISDEIKELMVTLKVPVEFIKEMLSNTNEEIEKEKTLIKKK